jgi:steroid 5-alpha reductase family enzyme
MRRRAGARFALVSLYSLFGLRAGLMWIVSLPVQVAQLAPTPDHLTWLDGLGALLWAVGISFETGARDGMTALTALRTPCPRSRSRAGTRLSPPPRGQ